MISLKIASIMAIAAFASGSLFAAPVQQAIAAVIATDVQCTGCVGTADVAGNAITAAKIKDGEVKAAEIATDAVGASELQGVSKLLYGQCAANSIEGSSDIQPGNSILVTCSINGVDSDDTSIAQIQGLGSCFEIRQSDTASDAVHVIAANECTTTQKLGVGTGIAIVAFDK